MEYAKIYYKIIIVVHSTRTDLEDKIYRHTKHLLKMENNKISEVRLRDK